MEHNSLEVWKIIFLSKWVICRFHVNLPGCTDCFYMGLDRTCKSKCNWLWCKSDGYISTLTSTAQFFQKIKSPISSPQKNQGIHHRQINLQKKSTQQNPRTQARNLRTHQLAARRRIHCWSVHVHWFSWSSLDLLIVGGFFTKPWTITTILGIILATFLNQASKSRKSSKFAKKQDDEITALYLRWWLEQLILGAFFFRNIFFPKQRKKTQNPRLALPWRPLLGWVWGVDHRCTSSNDGEMEPQWSRVFFGCSGWRFKDRDDRYLWCIPFYRKI